MSDSNPYGNGGNNNAGGNNEEIAPDPYGTPQSPYTVPDYGQPAYEQPVYGQPGYDQPTYDQPAYDQPTYEEPGYSTPGYNQPGYGRAQKSRMVAGLLGILLGSLGVHNFYLGRTGLGMAQLLITIVSCGFLAIVSSVWGLVEGVLYLANKNDPRWSTDGYGIPLTD